MSDVTYFAKQLRDFKYLEIKDVATRLYAIHYGKEPEADKIFDMMESLSALAAGILEEIEEKAIKK